MGKPNRSCLFSFYGSLLYWKHSTPTAHDHSRTSFPYPMSHFAHFCSFRRSRRHPYKHTDTHTHTHSLPLPSAASSGAPPPTPTQPRSPLADCSGRPRSFFPVYYRSLLILFQTPSSAAAIFSPAAAIAPLTLPHTPPSPPSRPGPPPPPPPRPILLSSSSLSRASCAARWYWFSSPALGFCW